MSDEAMTRMAARLLWGSLTPEVRRNLAKLNPWLPKWLAATIEQPTE
jgi:hypothetical protein